MISSYVTQYQAAYTNLHSPQPIIGRMSTDSKCSLAPAPSPDESARESKESKKRNTDSEAEIAHWNSL